MFSRGTTLSEYSLNGGDNDHVSLSLGCVCHAVSYFKFNNFDPLNTSLTRNGLRV